MPRPRSHVHLLGGHEGRGRPRTSTSSRPRRSRVLNDPRGWGLDGAVRFEPVLRRRRVPAVARQPQRHRGHEPRVQRRLQLPRRQPSDDQRRALAVRVGALHRAARRLPQLRDQPRGRPLARVRPRGLSGAGPAGAGDGPAVEGTRWLRADVAAEPAASARCSATGSRSSRARSVRSTSSRSSTGSVRVAGLGDRSRRCRADRRARVRRRCRRAGRRGPRASRRRCRASCVREQHGFDVTIPVAPGFHRVCAYAIGRSGRGNTTLGCAFVDNASPFGALDVVAIDGSVVRVAGWAIDPHTVRADRRARLRRRARHRDRRRPCST